MQVRKKAWNKKQKIKDEIGRWWDDVWIVGWANRKYKYFMTMVQLLLSLGACVCVYICVCKIYYVLRDKYPSGTQKLLNWKQLFQWKGAYELRSIPLNVKHSKRFCLLSINFFIFEILNWWNGKKAKRQNWTYNI